MGTDKFQSDPIALRGTTVELRPLQPKHASGLLDAAADRQLWTLKMRVIPRPETLDEYMADRAAGRDSDAICDRQTRYRPHRRKHTLLEDRSHEPETGDRAPGFDFTKARLDGPKVKVYSEPPQNVFRPRSNP